MRDRAYRREAERNKKRKVRTILERWWKTGTGVPEITEYDIGRLAHATTPCSGPCCGNPRKHFGQRTVQEKRHGFK